MPPMLSVVGRSRSGKTTFLEKLIPELKSRGYRVGIIKHAFHRFDLDREGKDSWRHKAAGADAVMVASAGRLALVRDMEAYELEDLHDFFPDMDLVLTEGFKGSDCPKIEIVRTARSTEPLCQGRPELLALVTDAAPAVDVPRFSLEEVAAVADFIEERFLR